MSQCGLSWDLGHPTEHVLRPRFLGWGKHWMEPLAKWISLDKQAWKFLQSLGF